MVNDGQWSTMMMALRHPFSQAAKDLGHLTARRFDRLGKPLDQEINSAIGPKGLVQKGLYMFY